MPEVQSQQGNKRIFLWALAVIIVCALVFAVITVTRSNNEQAAGTDVNAIDGAALLRYSGVNLATPDGYEFISETRTPSDETALYLYSLTDDAKRSTHPQEVRITDYRDTLSQRQQADAEQSGQPIVSAEAYATFLAQSGEGFLNLENYESSTDVDGRMHTVDVSFTQALSDEINISTTRRLLLNEDSNRFIQIDAVTPAPTNAFLGEFQAAIQWQ